MSRIRRIVELVISYSKLVVFVVFFSLNSRESKKDLVTQAELAARGRRPLSNYCPLVKGTGPELDRALRRLLEGVVLIDAILLCLLAYIAIEMAVADLKAINQIITLIQSFGLVLVAHLIIATQAVARERASEQLKR